MPKSPFVNYTPEQVFAREAIGYVIVAGYTMFDVRGKFIFDKKSADRFYKKILKELMISLGNGTKREKREALRVLRNLRVERLRIH